MCAPSASNADLRQAVHERLAAYSAVVLTCIFGVISYGRLGHDARDEARGDALKYLEMSEETFAPVDSPFNLRLLTPCPSPARWCGSS